MKKRVAILGGIRTPFCKAGGKLKNLQADDLGSIVSRELLLKLGLPPEEIQAVVAGNVAQPAEAANVARVLALRAGVPKSAPAFTVQRNCASGFQAITSCASQILLDEIDTGLVVATESMSNIPLVFSDQMAEFFTNLSKAKSLPAKLKTLATFRPGFLTPRIGLILGLTDPVVNMIMGKTAEVLAREFHITREEQDAFALKSHQKAEEATKKGRFAQEILPVPLPSKYEEVQKEDDGIRNGQTIEALGKLGPYFEKPTGTVTVGNASQVTDGACALVLTSEEKAKKLGIEPLGYLSAYAYSGCDPERMGMGPVYATHNLLKSSKFSFKDFKLFEINEAFAAQVLACQRAFASDSFGRDHLGLGSKLGEIPDDCLNVNGGAVALGHPVGASGARLALTLLKELRIKNQNVGLASLCVGGGQGGALALEVE